MYFKIIIIYICVLLEAVLVPAHAQTDSVETDTLPVPWRQIVVEKLQRLTDNDITAKSQLGLMVFDLDADSALFCHNHLQTMRPASTMKLVTAIAALDRLGGSYRFSTELRFSGCIEGSVLKGDLYCVGGFDPKFNVDDMNAFVEGLKQMGVDTIMGNVYADKSMKDSATLGEGWCWDDDNPCLSPLLISRKNNFVSRFVRKLSDNGVAIVDTNRVDIAYRFVNEAGGYIRRMPVGTFSVVARFHTIDQILMKMLKESDNLYAEAMFYQIAASTGARPASVADARKVINGLVKKIGLQPKDYLFADGSGLSLYNYVSPLLEVMLLRYAYRNDIIFNHLYYALPVAGVDGTLKSRMKQSPAFENVRAKTGTLTGVISLAGYCTASNGHRLCFSVINQGVLNSTAARKFQDSLCRILCE